MSGRTLTVAPLVLAVVGLGLLAYETVQTLRKVVIGTTGDILLYVGVGLFVLAAVLIVVDLMSSEDAAVDAAPGVGVAEPPRPTDS
jgi:uncharacterized membrane protein